MRWIRRIGLLALLAGALLGFQSRLLHIVIPARTVHNSHYLSSAFLYQLQTILGANADSPSVLDGKIVQRQGKELFVDLDRLVPGPGGTLGQIASSASDIGFAGMNGYMEKHYYQLTQRYPNLQALLKENPYR